MSVTFLTVGVLILGLVKANNPILWSWDYEEPVSLSTNEEVYRLPNDVIPLEYEIYIDLYFSEATDRPYTFDGRENIIIQAVKANVNQIVLHANVDSINDVNVTTQDGTLVLLDKENPFNVEPLYHFLKVNLVEPLAVGDNYTLIIDYTNTMNDGPMKRGLWRGWYTDDMGIERVYAATHFQPYNARQAFPCWDEPLYKSVFTLHLSRPSNYKNNFANTGIDYSENIENNRIRDHFNPSPVMSSYLVTFLVSETFTVIGQDTSFSPPIRFIGRSNTVGLANQTLDMAVKLVKYFDEYFDIPYSTLHPYLSNDHIASPDWASAGTENWGMVSYREMHLILDSSETLMSVEHYAGTLLSHELAHKWFGNLITCFWWSNTWINEGYASLFGYLATDKLFPQYEYLDHFNARYLYGSLSTDSGTSSAALNHNVNTPAQVTGHFGTISYSKAAAFLRMTASIITEETFKKSCRYFLKNNSYKATDQYDLFKAFEQAVNEDKTLEEYVSSSKDFNFTHYYDVWVNQPGYPLLTVTVNHESGEIALRQERFFLSATAATSDQIYPIPITVSTKRKKNFEKIKADYMMSAEKIVIMKDVGEEWVIVNNKQQGHYRVTYDDKTWSLIAEALINEPDTIHYLNRAQIVDDVFALMRSTRMEFSQGFEILRFLRNEKSYYVWNPAISGFSWLRSRMNHLPESQAEFDGIILNYMENVISEVTFEPKPNELPTISMLRQEVLHFACNLGHECCVKESVQKFVDMRENRNSADRRIRRNVYMNGVREGGQADFDYLLNRFHSSNIVNDKLEMLRGLGAAKDPQLLNRYLELMLNKEVRSHDKLNAFNYALLGNKQNVDTVLEFTKENIDRIRIAFVEDSPARPVHSALSNIASYLDEPGLEDYEDWLRSTQSSSLQFSSAISAINSARNNIQWGTANADIILAAARDGAVTAAISAVLLIVTASLAMLI